MRRHIAAILALTGMALTLAAETVASGNSPEADRIVPLAPIVKVRNSAMDYVQDGLIAMWDGIENVGWGLHDAGATAWKDLISGSVANIPEGYSFGTDHLQSAHNVPMRLQAGGGAVAQAVYAFTYTIEVCLKDFDKNANGISDFFGGIRSSFHLGFPSATRGIWMHTSNGSRYETKYANKYNTYTAWSSDNNNFKIFINGVAAAGTKIGTQATTSSGRAFYLNSENNSTTGVSGKYCSLRVYSRALSDEEIVHNYELDKVRFNLP